MPTLCLLHGTIQRCRKRSTSSSRGAWQRIPKIVLLPATNSLPLFILSRVRALHPRRPRPGNLFGGRSRSVSATFGSPQPPVCFSPPPFRSPVRSELASSFPSLRQSIFLHRACPPRPSPTHCKLRAKQRSQASKLRPFLKWCKNARTGASFAWRSLLPLQRSNPAIHEILKGIRLLISLPLHLWLLNLRPKLLPSPTFTSKLFRPSTKARWPSLRIANYFSPRTW